MNDLRKKIGQMLIMGFSGALLAEDSIVKRWIIDEGLGGVILFDYDLIQQKQGKNLVDVLQIKSLTTQLQRWAEQAQLPLFIALDYEGGAVDRLGHIKGCPVTKSAAELSHLNPEQQEFEIKQMAKTLQTLGFNLNFAPILDLNLKTDQGIIGKLGRSFAAEPEQVATLARRFVSLFQQHKIQCCYKHFPGHGSACGDTHQGFVDVSEQFQPIELEPYRILLKENKQAPMIMTAHVINRVLDESGLPATLSTKILTDLLRSQLGFEGVIISDDLQMQAIANHYALDESLTLSINAGADMLIFANQLGEITVTEVLDRIEKLIINGHIPMTRILESYNRIKALKASQWDLSPAVLS